MKQKKGVKEEEEKGNPSKTGHRMLMQSIANAEKEKENIKRMNVRPVIDKKTNPPETLVYPLIAKLVEIVACSFHSKFLCLL